MCGSGALDGSLAPACRLHVVARSPPGRRPLSIFYTFCDTLRGRGTGLQHHQTDRNVTSGQALRLGGRLAADLSATANLGAAVKMRESTCS